MAEYIEREAVKSAIYEIMDKYDSYDKCDSKAVTALQCADDAIDLIPAADVVPVRHGRWVEVEVKELAYYKMMIASMRCDQCERYHNEVYHYGNPTEMAKYCGFCGARMDGDEEV